MGERLARDQKSKHKIRCTPEPSRACLACYPLKNVGFLGEPRSRFEYFRMRVVDLLTASLGWAKANLGLPSREIWSPFRSETFDQQGTRLQNRWLDSQQLKLHEPLTYSHVRYVLPFELLTSAGTLQSSGRGSLDTSRLGNG